MCLLLVWFDLLPRRNKSTDRYDFKGVVCGTEGRKDCFYPRKNAKKKQDEKVKVKVG